MAFTPVDLPTYPPDITGQVIDDYSARFPSWEPSDANPEVVLVQEIAFALAQTNEGLAQREIAELELIGRRRGRPRRAASQAVGLARFTVAAGFTLPAATQGTVTGPAGLVAFQTLDQAGGTPGVTVLADVPVIAVLGGPQANTATGAGAVYDQFDDVIGVEVTAPFAGGQDEEELQVYLDELVDFLQLYFDDPTLCNARQVAIFVRSHPLVERVLVLNLHVPAGGRLPFPDGATSAVAVDNVAGAIGAYPILASGELLPAFSKAEVALMVEERREAGMILGVGDPTYTPINVTFSVSTVGPDPAGTVAAAVAAVRGSLSPAVRGLPTTGDQTLYPGLFVVDRLVRYSELYALIDNVPGVNHVESLTLTGVRSYTVAAATDVFTVAAHSLLAADQVTISAPAAGAPMAAGIYHVRDVTADTFKLAATSGGLPVDVTTDGTGNIARVAAANTNYTLVGPAPLTRPGTITGTLGP